MDISQLMMHKKPTGKLFEEEKLTPVNRNKAQSSRAMAMVTPIFESIDDNKQANDKGTLYITYSI